MPPKPKPTRVTRTGNVVPNEAATAAGGALMDRNFIQRDFAIETLLADIEARHPAVNRYVRVRDAIEKRFGCSRSSAERVIRLAKLHLAERFAEELPTRRAEICEQLQRIADEQEMEQPMAAIAALREIATIVGLHAPKRLDVTVDITPEQRASIEALKMTPHERRARLEELRMRAALAPPVIDVELAEDAEPS